MTAFSCHMMSVTITPTSSFQVFNSLIETGKAHLDGTTSRRSTQSLACRRCRSPRPPLYFGGSSDAGIEFSAGLADKYLTWASRRRRWRRKLPRCALPPPRRDGSDLRYPFAFHRA